VLSEVSALEKALTKKDLGAQQGSLERIAQALRPLQLQSLAGLEFNARGRLLTTVLRVQRQPRPAAPEAPPPEAAPSEPSAEAPAEGAAPEPGISAEGAAPVAPGAPAAAAADPWADLMVAVGRTWRAAGEGERAAQAFEASGRPAPPDEAPVAPSQPAERPDRGGRAERPAREGREKREARPARGEARPPRPVREPMTDWQLHARRVEESGRTRDAARIHEKHKGFLEAGRLYLVSNDKKAALRAFVLGGEEAAARKLMSELPAAEFRPVLEQAQGWGLLMEHLVQVSDFEGVARLYERAKQFDQAGLAWERAGKLPQARKAFERAKDAAGTERVRAAEVQKLVERGDRLGAAQLLAQSGNKAAVLETLAPLPRAKAYRFLQRVGLDEEAQGLGREELQKAEASGRHDERARWLELTGDFPASAEAWLAAGRRERALQVFEKLGDWARAAPLAEELLQYERAVALFHKAGNTADAERVAALPPPARPAPPEAAAQAGDEGNAETPESLPHPGGGA
jgi:tetratricopeptide (TPR) repeat protein